MKEMLINLFFDKEEIVFLAKLFALSIYSDRKINPLELNELEIDIKKYIDTYYFMINSFLKKKLSEYLYEKVLKFLEQMKDNNEVFELYKKEVTYGFKLLKRKKEYQKIDFILNLVKFLLLSDKVFTEEEKRFFEDLKEIIKE